MTALPAAPGRHALEDRPQGMTFEAGSGGLSSTHDDYLAFARMHIGDIGSRAGLLVRHLVAS